MILVYVTQEATEAEVPGLLKYVAMAIEILETMDECIVAVKAAQMLRRASENADKKFSAAASATAAAAAPSMVAPAPHESEAMFHWNQYWGPLNFVGGEMELDFSVFQMPDLDGGNPLVGYGEQGEYHHPGP